MFCDNNARHWMGSSQCNSFSLYFVTSFSHTICYAFYTLFLPCLLFPWLYTLSIVFPFLCSAFLLFSDFSFPFSIEKESQISLSLFPESLPLYLTLSYLYTHYFSLHLSFLTSLFGFQPLYSFSLSLCSASIVVVFCSLLNREGEISFCHFWSSFFLPYFLTSLLLLTCLFRSPFPFMVSLSTFQLFSASIPPSMIVPFCFIYHSISLTVFTLFTICLSLILFLFLSISSCLSRSAFSNIFHNFTVSNCILLFLHISLFFHSFLSLFVSLFIFYYSLFKLFYLLSFSPSFFYFPFIALLLSPAPRFSSHFLFLSRKIHLIFFFFLYHRRFFHFPSNYQVC